MRVAISLFNPIAWGKMLTRIGKKKKKEIASEYGLSPSC
jgi:hypothetical protein